MVLYFDTCGTTGIVLPEKSNPVAGEGDLLYGRSRVEFRVRICGTALSRDGTNSGTACAQAAGNSDASRRA